jgi:tungstate transport system permease protein
MQLLWDGLVGALQLLLRRDPLVLAAAWRSLWISGSALCLAALFGVPCGSLLAQARFPGRRALIVLCRIGMSVPTVLIGLACYALFSRRGPLGGLDLLYTPWAIVAGEFFLALPIVVTWTQNSLAHLDPRAAETAVALGAGPWLRWWTCLSEVRRGISLALLTAFARCFTELGIAMMVGGNVKYRTRTLTTATALETARGEFERGVAMSLILLFMAVLVTVLIAGFTGYREDK